jgi:hypothetical protein
MKLEEFYAELKKLYTDHPGSLTRAMAIEYNVNSSLAIQDILLGLPKRYWIKRLSMAVIIYEARTDLMIKADKMDMSKHVVEALKNLAQEDFDKEFKEIKERLKEVLEIQ